MVRRRRAGAAALWLAVLSAAGCGLLRVDVVGFRYRRDESKSFVMRVVALPGEEIEIWARSSDKQVGPDMLRIR